MNWIKRLFSRKKEQTKVEPPKIEPTMLNKVYRNDSPEAPMRLAQWANRVRDKHHGMGW